MSDDGSVSLGSTLVAVMVTSVVYFPLAFLLGYPFGEPGDTAIAQLVYSGVGVIGVLVWACTIYIEVSEIWDAYQQQHGGR